MFGIELSWQFMRDLGLVVFVGGAALAAVGFSFSRICLESSPPPNDTLMAIGDAMMLAGACLAVTAMGIGYLMPAGNP